MAIIADSGSADLGSNPGGPVILSNNYFSDGFKIEYTFINKI